MSQGAEGLTERGIREGSLEEVSLDLRDEQGVSSVRGQCVSERQRTHRLSITRAAVPPWGCPRALPWPSERALLSEAVSARTPLPCVWTPDLCDASPHQEKAESNFFLLRTVFPETDGKQLQTRLQTASGKGVRPDSDIILAHQGTSHTCHLVGCFPSKSRVRRSLCPEQTLCEHGREGA